MQHGRLAIVVLLACLGGACARQATPVEPVVVHVEPAPEKTLVYVVMPWRYSNYVERGLIFQSSGQLEDLPVYRTVEEANRALFALETMAERSRGGWLVYTLDADWQTDVVPQDDGYRLARSAIVVSYEPRAYLDDTDRL